MESLDRLHRLLLSATRGVLHEDDLFQDLLAHKSSFLNLFDVGGRSPQEQRELESGKILLDGRQVAVNAEFTRHALFLSQQLEASERYVAGLLHQITTQNPNISVADSLEVTVSLFHKQRRVVVQSLSLLLDIAEAAESSSTPTPFTKIWGFVQNDLFPAAPQASLSQRIVRELQNLGNTMVKAEAALTNARTATIAPSGQPGIAPSLGYECLNGRCESFRFERRTLGACLSTIARLGYLAPNEIKTLVDWLCSTPTQFLTFHLLTAVLSVFDPVAPGGAVDTRRVQLTQSDMMTYMSKKLATEWKEPGLKAAILLKWTLFLTEARHRDPSLEHRSGFKTEELEAQIWSAVQGDAFTYLSLVIAHVQRRQGTSIPSLIGQMKLSAEQQELWAASVDEFAPKVLAAFELLIRSLITHASSELRKIKQRQEDLVLAGARTDRTRAGPTRFGSTHPPENPTAPPRNDIAVLYSFIGLLYASLEPECAVQFWGSTPLGHSHSYMEYTESNLGRLPVFLQWAVWSTQGNDNPMTTSLYDMLNGLANGQQCSELAHNFMARGGGEVVPGSSLPSSSGAPSVSWTAVFNLLDSWSTPIATRAAPPPQFTGFGMSAFNSHNNPPAPPQPQTPTLGPQDVFLAQAFLGFLSTVVSNSVAVRKAIAGHAHFRAIPTLVSLIPLGIPLEIKGALFDTLAAFSQPGAGAAGLEICRSIWILMERYEVINVRTSSANLPPGKGVEMELDEIEAVHRIYPSTMPFLRLLATLIHTPKRIPLRERLMESVSFNTIPESLGQPYRVAGIGPFINFVVDNVFANIAKRDYLNPSDRWQTNDLCLGFIERALASYDLESLVRASSDAQLRGETITSLLIHPGYDVLQRLLTTCPLQSSLLMYVAEGVGGFEQKMTTEEGFYGMTMTRVLRIVLRVLEIQDMFLDVLLPILHEMESVPIIGKPPPRTHFTKLDQALSYNGQLVTSLAAYVVIDKHPELVLLSVKILSILSSSTAFPSLATVIQRSDECDRILAGYSRLLENETIEDLGAAESFAEQYTGAGAPDAQTTNTHFGLVNQATRLAVLHFFIRNTDSPRQYPNIAHFFLFGTTKGIEDPRALGGRRSCIHTLIDLVSYGIPRLDQISTAPQVDPLFILLPGLAEPVYRIIHQLCIHPRTSEFTMRYLRTREDFFARQLAAIPSRVSPTLSDPAITVVYVDGARVTTTVPALSSFLRLRSWIFDLAALDLHVLTSKGHTKGVTDLLDILFGNESAPNPWAIEDFREVGQSHLRIIEFAQSLAFDWADSLDVASVDLRFLGQLNLHSCVRRDANGCEIIDRTCLLALLSSARRTLNAQGSIVTPASAEQVDSEIKYILESCAVENHRREVAFAKSVGYESWKRLLDVTLTKCFSRLPHDYRENMLFDLLHVLPTILRSEDLQESTTVLLAEAVLSAVTKLREDRRHQILVQSANGDADAGSLPAERLYGILRAILECVVENNRIELVRGNLYAAVINYVHLITPANTLDSSLQDLRLSMAMSTTRDEFGFSDSRAVVPARGTSPASLVLGTLALMKPAMERLIATIARDAIDGSEVWKTIAFMLLDSLVQLSSCEKQHVALTTLARQGILANFVRGIKDSDMVLQSVLKPDPDDLNPLYVYEAKMSFLVRMAQTRLGAERLLETQIIPILSQCDYLDARPEADQSFVDHDSFLPSAIQRYHQLLMPALQLVQGMLATLGSKHATAAAQGLELLSSHSGTIVIMLKNEVEHIPLAFVEEMHLVVSLCSSILSHVPKAELSSPHSGFGAIHGAILALATKCLGGGRWLADIAPQTDAEMLSASMLAIGHGPDTKFDVAKRQKERLMRRCIVEYLGVASDFTEPEINPLLSPVATAPRHEERGPHFLATIPTIGDALDALNTLCADLSNTLQQIADISAELAANEHVGVDNIAEMLPDADPAFLRSLDIPQKRALVCRELAQERRTAEGEARTLIGTAEMLLLLLWRHVVYYADGNHPHPPPPSGTGTSSLKASTTYALRFLSPPDPEHFRGEIAKRLGPVLLRLAALDLGAEGLRGSAAYMEIMSRRLRDSAGMLDDTTDGAM